MLHDTQRTSAPSSDSVSMSTPVWIVMWRLPMMRAPANGFFPSYRLRIAIRPGISPSASRSSFRPNSARLRSATLYGTRPACFACSYAWTPPLTAVAIALFSPRCLSSRRVYKARPALRFIHSRPAARPVRRTRRESLLHCYCGEQCRSLRVGIDRQHSHANILETGTRQQARDLTLGKPEPHMAHLLLIFLTVVRQHVH